jgi:hypothetical protein
LTDHELAGIGKFVINTGGSTLGPLREEVVMRFHHGFAVLAVAFGAPVVGAQEPAPRPARALLVTSDANREFQFARVALSRAEQAGRVELAVHSTAPLLVVADPQLKRFPNLLRPADRVKAEERAYNLSAYDAIIAVDVDWSQVEPESLVLLQKWVERGGGLVVVAGATHTPALSRAKADGDALQPLRDLLPVVLQKPDDQPRPPANRVPARLMFGDNKPVAPFLKLDPDGTTDLAGWNDFFGGAPPRRGFFSCFPVESLKKGAIALATFGDERREARPWLATHTVGKGRVIWVGSPEVYRLRAYSEAFHERFWVEMTRYAAAPGRPQ